MSRLRLLLTLVFVTAMTMMWQSLKQPPATLVASPQSGVDKPDYIAVDLQRTVYNAQGQKTQQLSAAKMTYFKSQDKAVFGSPRLELQSTQNNSRWQISSEQGILYNNQRLILDQSVVAVNLTATDPIDRIIGERFRINSEDSTMLSEHPVKILGDGIEITGSGLIADLNQERIELINHAKTIYQPATR